MYFAHSFFLIEACLFNLCDKDAHTVCKVGHLAMLAGHTERAFGCFVKYSNSSLHFFSFLCGTIVRKQIAVHF